MEKAIGERRWRSVGERWRDEGVRWRVRRRGGGSVGEVWRRAGGVRRRGGEEER